MINIIVAFPKIENGKSIKNILIKSGFQVGSVCVTGAQVLQNANMLGDGIVVCGYRLQDMIYTELQEYLPPHFQMLMVASPNLCEEREIEDIVCLSMPLKVHELVSTMEMMVYAMERQRKKRKSMPKERSQEEKQLIQQAKELLMIRNNMTEEEAHRYMQKTSMDSGTGITETAQMILSMLS